MKRQSLPWMLGMFLVASTGSFGCDDGDPPKADASVTGGAGGAATGGAGGAGGRGGTGGTAAGGSDAAAGAGGGGAGGTDAGGDAAKGGTDGGSSDVGAGGTAGSDAKIDGTVDGVSDMAPVPDAVADMTTTQPDAASTMQVTQCSQINCADFFAITNACTGLDQTCTKQDIGAITNVCHMPNGTKRKISSVDIIEDHITTVQVYKADGNPCYTVELATKTGDPVERWTFKTPAGAVFATGGHDTAAANFKNYLVCGGVRYNISDDRACSGTESDPSGSCTAGTCAIP